MLMEACNREGNTKNEMKLLKARSVWCQLADVFIRMVGVSHFCEAAFRQVLAKMQRRRSVG